MYVHTHAHTHLCMFMQPHVCQINIRLAKIGHGRPTLCKALGSDLLNLSMDWAYGLVGQREADSLPLPVWGRSDFG